MTTQGLDRVTHSRTIERNGYLKAVNGSMLSGSMTQPEGCPVLRCVLGAVASNELSGVLAGCLGRGLAGGRPWCRFGCN